MKSISWIKLVIRMGGVFLLVMMGLPVAAPASAGFTTAGIPAVSPLPGNSAAPTKPSVAGDELWGSQFELGADDSTFAAVFAPNGDLYVGGDFLHIGGVSANYVAHWNASTDQWSPLGVGVNNRVWTLAFSGNTLYVGGIFNQAGGLPVGSVASYNINTHTWSSMAGGVTHAVTEAEVRALAVDGSGNLYVGGQFDTAGSVSAMNVARWNGSSWSALSFGIGGTTGNDEVYALAVSGSDVYAGGTFSTPSDNIAYFNGSTWSGLGSGTDNDVYALAISGSDLYVGGGFTKVNGSLDANYIAHWNTGTSAWSALGSGVDGPDVDAIAVDSNGNVFVAGRFRNAGGSAASRVAIWSGNSIGWNRLQESGNTADGVDNNALGLAIHGSDLIVTGSFTHAGDYPAPHLAHWAIDNLKWYSPGNTVNGNVYAIATRGSDVYVGGDFTSAGGLPARDIARYNTASNRWFTLGNGLSNALNGCDGVNCSTIVITIAVVGSDIYVGGNFNSIGSMTVNNLAYYDGSHWNAVDGGLTGCIGGGCSTYVSTLVHDRTGLDVGGNFNQAGGTTVNNIAYWSGAGGSWHAFSNSAGTITGTNGPVEAIATDGFGNYYFGGYFTSPETNLAYFDGFDWYPYQSTLNSIVYCIALVGNDVYVGGQFKNAAGSGADNIAVSINGGDWEPLGSSLDNYPRSMAVRGSTLYVGGVFTTSGTQSLNYVAAWDTVHHKWSNLGSGLDSYVFGLAVTNSFVYVGGRFSMAGGKISQNLGSWGAYQTEYLPVVRR